MKRDEEIPMWAQWPGLAETYPASVLDAVLRAADFRCQSCGIEWNKSTYVRYQDPTFQVPQIAEVNGEWVTTDPSTLPWDASLITARIIVWHPRWEAFVGQSPTDLQALCSWCVIQRVVAKARETMPLRLKPGRAAIHDAALKPFTQGRLL